MRVLASFRSCRFSLFSFYAGCLTFLSFVFQSQDVAFLEKLIKDDIERGKLPLLLVANAGRCHEPESSILDIQDRGLGKKKKIGT